MGRQRRTTRITTGVDGIGSWALHRSSPAPQLQGLVARQVRWRATHVEPAVTGELPSGKVQLIVAPVAPVDVRDPTDHRRPGRGLHALVGGLDDHHAVTANTGDSVGVQFGLTAAGAAELLGVPPKELRGRVVDLHDLIGADADRLVDDVEAHRARAVAAGADADPIADTDDGSREYGARDLEGNSWHVGTYDPWSP